MIGQKFDNFPNFYTALDSILKDEKEWKKVSVNGIKNFINLNLGWILAQTQNVTIAPNAQELKDKLLNLSNKINEKFEVIPAAHNLAFEIMGIAQGIFSKEEDKLDFTSELPSEIKQKIYSELITMKDEVLSGLEPIRFISKQELITAKDTQIARINNENLSLNAVNCNTTEDAIQYINKNQNLYYVNLTGFYLTSENIKELQNCTWIKNLSICSNTITDEALNLIKRMPFSINIRLPSKSS
jgi:hypothetical protein